MKSVCLLVLAAAVCFAAGSLLSAQNNPNEEQGLKPYDSLHGGDLDSVSLTSGGLTLHIPLASFPQRGALDLSFFIRFSNKQWYVHPAKYDSEGHQIQPATWVPANNSGVQIISSVDWWLQGTWAPDVSPQYPNGVDWSRSVTSPDGNNHQFGGDTSGTTTGPLYPMRSLDTTGLLHTNLQTLIQPNGTRYTYPLTGPGLATGPPPSFYKQGVQPNAITDANGNQITITSTGWTDTMGRVIPGTMLGSYGPVVPGVATSNLSGCPTGTTSASVWNVPGPANVNNGVRTFYFCYAMFTLSTNFNPGTQPNDFPPTSTSLLNAVVLPDGTMWTFNYDSYGDVTNVGFPTGGSLSYTYEIGPETCSTGTNNSTWVTSRTVNANDGSGGHTWTYNYQAQGNNLFSVSGATTVTSPDGNATVHTIGPPVSGAICTGYDLETQYFQGSASSGTVLKTVQNQYDGTSAPPGGPMSEYALNIVLKQTTTTSPEGQLATVVNTWDTPTPDPQNQLVRVGSLLQKDEYDYANTLARSTLNRYLWQDNSTYASNNFVLLSETVTVKDGAGNQVAQTTYAYDQNSLAPSGVGTPTHVGPPAGEPTRGNRTTTNNWLNTTNSFLSSTATYFDTGMLASSTPPVSADGQNRTTTYTYSSTFLGAYLTQTNMPSTQMPDPGATVVQHVISGNYDFNAGLLTTFIDENGQPFTYQYDNMLRITQGNHPDGGQTLFTYPNANSVLRQRLIGNNVYDSFTANFDGVGRTYETQHATPSGTVEVDTTYDSLGRVSIVSNPYYQGTSHSSDPTYGVTQNQYDALSRVTKTIKQDGSISTVQYDAPAGDGQGSSVVCTTATDEAGNKRQVCNDGLGRMVKVIEPNPGAAATNATGWLAVSGSEQSAQSQQAQAGQTTVTISGGEQSGQYCPLGRCHTIWDAGTVTITVNGHSDMYQYSKLDTTSSVASGLAGNINLDSGAYVTASAIGTTITLTATTKGASTNYSFSTSSATTDTTGTFSGPSFFASPGSGSLTNGQNASNTYDTGTVTANINGANYSVSFGSSDTPSTIAANLTNAINAGSLANASASGGTINLTSKTPGTAGDYSLSASYTWNNGQFTNPSFTTSTSSSALTGALDAGAVNNNPFVTTYQYNARGDMLCVHQKATDTTADVACTGSTPPSVSASWRQRFFTYDSLSRLLTAMNPENNSTGSSVIAYSYDADGNVVSKTEPAPNQAWQSPATVTISYTYDALNRLLNTTYSDGVTPNTAHRYDYSSFLGQTFTYSVGREVAATSANNTVGFFTSYDPIGRVAQTVQCTPGVTGCKTFVAGYDKLGDVTNLAYPSGLTVTYGYDNAGRLISASDSNGIAYAQNPTLVASGAMQEFTAPSFNNNKYHVAYNNRLQPVEIWAGSAEGSGALFDKQYQYNPPNTSQVNNGNVYAITNVKDSTRTQAFTYDSLNRLISAGDQSHWYNTYAYDAWGNLTQKTKGTLPYGENLSTGATSGNQLLGYSYDAAGNMLNDGINGWTYVYDAENRITTGGSVTYKYDADGRRVNKSSGTNYWYGPTGAVLAETDSSGNWTNYIFFGGQRLARNVNGTVNYYVTDHLHSTAVFASSSGTVLDDNDFYPWGGVVPGVGQTTSTNTVKFTGQYRDSESNLDYFGARYYENATGRFMTPDWDARPTTVPYAEFGDPQSLNLYSYVRNSPITRVDLAGHMVVGFTNDGVFGARGTGVDDGSGGLGDSDSNGYALNWTAVTVTYNGTTTTIEVPSWSSPSAASDSTTSRKKKSTKDAPKKASGNPDHLKPGKVHKLPNGTIIQVFQVVDKDGKPVRKVYVQEHVAVLFAINARVETNPNFVYYETGEILDHVGPEGTVGEKHVYFKTEQTFTAVKDGQSFPLSTKVNQYYDANNGKISAAKADIIVP